MVGVRSLITWMAMALGMEACRRGSRSRTRCTVSMMLAPGSFCTNSTMDGLPLLTP